MNISFAELTFNIYKDEKNKCIKHPKSKMTLGIVYEGWEFPFCLQCVGGKYKKIR